MTPRETYMAIEAAVWRDQRLQARELRAAWYTAALSRARRLPSLQQFLTPPARRLRGEELQRRREEFATMKAAADATGMDKLTKRLAK